MPAHLSETDLTNWLFAVVSKASRARDRGTWTFNDKGEENLLPLANAVEGETLLAQAVFVLDRVVKGMYGWSGQDKTQLSDDDAELYLVTKQRLMHLIRKLEHEHQGAFKLNPLFEGDEEARRKKWGMPESFKVTQEGVRIAKEHIRGTRWERLAEARGDQVSVLGQD